MVSRFEDGTSVGLRYLTDEVECLSFKQGACCGWGKSYPAYSHKKQLLAAFERALVARAFATRGPLRCGDRLLFCRQGEVGCNCMCFRPTLRNGLQARVEAHAFGAVNAVVAE